jgi:hypothetical protein
LSGYRMELLNPPISRVAAHGFEKFCCAAHVREQVAGVSCHLFLIVPYLVSFANLTNPLQRRQAPGGIGWYSIFRVLRQTDKHIMIIGIDLGATNSLAR